MASERTWYDEGEHMKYRLCILPLAGALALLLTAGCASTRRAADADDTPGLAPELARADAFYRQGRYTEAMIECINVQRRAPETPGLPELQVKVVQALTELQGQVTALEAEPTRRRMLADADRRMNLPSTYGLNLHIEGETSPLRTATTAMQDALERPVSLHLDQVTLDELILAIGESEGINMIADSFTTPQTLTVHADQVPLSEILEFAARNLNVQFYVGHNVIWVTPRDPSESPTPMDTRVYRLRRGISYDEVSGGPGGLNIVAAIERFIPTPQGADMLFDMKAHSLLVKNTRQNLAKVEEIIAALDITPPQVVIEARFISTGVSDLRELGLDWVLNSPLNVTHTMIQANGQPERAVRSRINSGAGITHTPFPGSGTGLNLTYQGLLTDPMFQAVLHALETSGKARTLSVPKVTTVNNRPAMMRVGEDFRYFETYDVQSVPSGQSPEGTTVYSSILVPVGTPSLEELGIELNVSPSVGADRRAISLHIIPSITEFVRYETFEVGTPNQNFNQNQQQSGVATSQTSVVRLPVFRKSIVETEVIVQSGETVVMGGLITSSETNERSGVPFLSSIPFLGRFFEHDSVQRSTQNLLIFVTATIISERGENLLPLYGNPETDGTQLLGP